MKEQNFNTATDIGGTVVNGAMSVGIGFVTEALLQILLMPYMKTKAMKALCVLGCTAMAGAAASATVKDTDQIVDLMQTMNSFKEAVNRATDLKEELDKENNQDNE